MGRYVILGNHRDAWTYGAVDPNSGTAALLEVSYLIIVLGHFQLFIIFLLRIIIFSRMDY